MLNDHTHDGSRLAEDLMIAGPLKSLKTEILLTFGRLRSHRAEQLPAGLLVAGNSPFPAT
jgi:hypothetical protein